MHEFSVMSQIVDNILEEARQRNATKVEQVNIEIGDFTMLGEEQLRFAFEVLTKDTIMQGATLDVSQVRGKVQCPSCGYEGRAKVAEDSPHKLVPILECPKCAGAARILEGRECVIRNIRMAVPDV